MISASSTTTQVVEASADSGITGTKFTFPPGSLTIDTAITVEEGVPLANSDVSSELGISDSVGLSAAGASVVIAPKDAVDPALPFTVSITLDGSNSLALQSSDTSHIVILYKVRKMDAGGAYFIGAFNSDQLHIDGNLVTFSSSYFGSFQAAYVKEEIRVEERPTAAPVVTKREDASKTVANPPPAPPTPAPAPAPPPATAPLKDPANFQVTAVSPNAATLSWTHAGESVGFALRYQAGQTVASGCRKGSFATTTSSQRSLTVSNLSPGLYTFRLCTLGSSDRESAGILVSATLPPGSDSTAPAAVTSLAASSRLHSVSLSWNHSGTDVAKFRITATGFAPPQEIAWPTLNFEWKGLTTNTSYTFSVSAVDAAGNASTAQNVTVTPTLPTVSCTDRATITDASGQGDHFEIIGTKLLTTSGAGYRSIRVFDLSNPASPALVSDYDLSPYAATWYPRGLVVAPDQIHAYMLNDLGNLVVLNVQNPTAPTFVSSTAAGAAIMGLAICNNMLYAALQQLGVAAYDLSIPAAPTLKDTKTIAEANTYPYGISCLGSTVFLGDGGSSASTYGLRVYQYDSASQMLLVKADYLGDTHSWGGSSAPTADGKLYMSWSDASQLAIFNVSDVNAIPAPTTIGGAGDANGQPILIDDYLYANKHPGVAIFDLSGPSPEEIFLWNANGAAHVIRRFAVGGLQYLAASNNSNEIRICELSGL